MEGLIPEAIRKMENLRSKHDVELGVAMALLYFHGKAKMVDRCTNSIALESKQFIITNEVRPHPRVATPAAPALQQVIAKHRV